ncbi:hypothetical protein ElyMa_005124300 [Elysia marginata]|uniref:Uncharacterized protein n=1 Tax=Elysia marginata TaxID=1093978 RepID=A0AAV4JM99_9GAST|nr:hypothetical protein ElyMa_005124300 [Elysia marginata]
MVGDLSDCNSDYTVEVIASLSGVGRSTVPPPLNLTSHYVVSKMSTSISFSRKQDCELSFDRSLRFTSLPAAAFIPSPHTKLIVIPAMLRLGFLVPACPSFSFTSNSNAVTRVIRFGMK